MCSFEVHDDDIAQEVKDWEGASISYNCNYEAPLTFLVFELHRHNVPQKNTFSTLSSDSKPNIKFSL